MRVLKFGGTSVATAERRATLARVVSRAAREDEVVVVVSALAGVTNALLETVDGRCCGEELLVRLRERHMGEIPEDGGDAVRCQLERRLREVSSLLSKQSSLTARHGILASGERLAIPLVLAALRRQGLSPRSIDGSDLLVVHGTGPAPEIDIEATRRRLHSRFQPGVCGRVTVVPGFVARDRRGQTTTLGRGASDLSATLLGSLLKASEVEIWTDVDGVLSAPPSLVPEAAPITHLSRDEASAFAHFGARVLHPLALAPLMEAEVPLCIRNTLKPEEPGTRVETISPEIGVKGVSAIFGASRFVVRLPWSRCKSGRVLAELEELGIRPLLMASEVAAQTLLLVVQQSDVKATNSALERLLGRGSCVQQHHRLAVVAMVGTCAESAVRVEQELLCVLKEEGVQALGFVRQDHAVTVLVDGNYGGRVARVLHNRLIVLKRFKEGSRREAA